MNRQEWLNQLKTGDKVNFLYKDKEPRKMLIRIADDERLFMVNASMPKSDLAKGETVWREHGEGPFGERIEPIEDYLDQQIKAYSELIVEADYAQLERIAKLVEGVELEDACSTAEPMQENPVQLEAIMSKFVDSTSDERTVNNVMRHAYRVLSDDEKIAMQAIKDKGLELYNLIENLGNSRELSLAKTKTEEAVMWAIKHLTA